MTLFSRWLAPAVLASALGATAFAPTTAHAQSNDIMRVIVDVADVIMRGGQPYYRHGDYGRDDRLVMGRDRYGRPVYYRVAPQPDYRHAPRGNAYGYYGNAPRAQRGKCNKHGKCKVEYYDPRYDHRSSRQYRDRYDNRYDDRYYSYGGRRGD